MKRIEQASNEYAGITDDKFHNCSHIYSPNDMSSAFEAGVEFAQRWIPIEEELPHVNIDVLLMDENKSTVIGFLNKYGVFQVDRPKGKITHWRKINIE